MFIAQNLGKEDDYKNRCGQCEDDVEIFKFLVKWSI